ncbi:MAG: DUF4902 domain-containing protein [Acidovorax sp.]
MVEMIWKDCFAGAPLPRLSKEDGFVRLSLDAILGVRLEHLLSGLEREVLRSGVQCGAATTVCGFSEWASRNSPRVSLGWDWRLSWEHGLIGLVRVGLPRSNVMLVDHRGIDYDWERNLVVLGTVVDALPWRDDTEYALARCTI